MYRITWGKVQSESHWIKQSYVGKVQTVNVGIIIIQSHVGYSTDRVMLCIIIIQSHVGYNTGGVPLGTVQTESRCA